ncbi:MAG TPA: hypothetical protein VLJ86_07325 [Ramlibacter sp.]|nr:hypothetical protein [Ramlibacter sp.]
MSGLKAFSGLANQANAWIGKLAMWFVLAATLIGAASAIVRKAFDAGFASLFESQWYLFAAVFVLAAGYALLKTAHTRIDFQPSRPHDDKPSHESAEPAQARSARSG